MASHIKSLSLQPQLKISGIFFDRDINHSGKMESPRDDLERLPEVFGTKTDLYLKSQIDQYRSECNSGERLREALRCKGRKQWEVEWERWIKCVDKIEHGIVCCTALNYCLVDYLLYEFDVWYWYKVGKATEERVKNGMIRSLFMANMIIDIIGGLRHRVETKHMMEKEYLDEDVIACRKAAYDIILEVSEKNGFQQADTAFYDECKIGREVMDLEYSDY